MNNTFAYAFAYQSKDKEFHMVRVDFSGSNKLGVHKLQMFKAQSNALNHAYFFTQDKAYFVGSIKEIKSHRAYSKRTWDEYVGFISSTDNADITGCSSITINYDMKNQKSQGLSLSSYTSLGLTTSTTYTLQSSTMVTKPLQSTIEVSQKLACTSVPQYTITTPTYTNQEYKLGSGVFSYQISASSITETCSDTYFMYAPRLSNGDTLPNFITFVEWNRTFVIESSSLNDIGTYTIVIYSYLLNGQMAQEDFQLDVVLDCTGVTISTGVILVPDYTIDLTPMIYQFPAFTSTNVLCEPMLTVRGASNTALPSIFNIVRSNRTLICTTLDPADAGTYNLEIVATTDYRSDGYNVVFTFNVTVIDPCPTATVTAGTIASFTYYIYQGAHPITPPFTLSVSTQICGDFQYTYTDISDNPLNQAVFFTNTPGVLTIYSQDENLVTSPNSVAVLIRGYPGTYSALEQSTTFTVTFGLDCIYNYISTPGNITTLTLQYEIESVVMTVPIGAYTVARPEPTCPGTLEYECYDVTNNQLCTVDNIVVFAGDASQIDIGTSDYTKAGLYQIELRGKFGNITRAITLELGIYAACDKVIVAKTPISDVYYDINQNENVTIATLDWQHNGRYDLCGIFTYQIREAVNETTLPSIIKINNGVITLHAFDATHVMVKTVEIVGTQTIAGYQFFDTFLLTISSNCSAINIATVPIGNQTYYISDDPLVLTYGPWTTDLTFCGSLTYTITQNGSAVAAPFSIDTDAYTLTLETEDILDVGLYEIHIHAEIPIGFGNDLTFVVNVTDVCINLTINHPPIVNHYYMIGSGSQFIFADQWELSHPQCGNPVFTATYDDEEAFPIPQPNTSPFAEWIEADKKFKFDTGDSTMDNQGFMITLTAKLAGKVAEVSFMILLSDSCKVTYMLPSALDTTNFTLPAQSYTIGQPAHEVPFNSFQQIFNCNFPVTYTVSATGIPASTNITYINNLTSPMKVLIQASSNQFARQSPYDVKIIASVVNDDQTITTAFMTFKLTLISQNKAAPIFKPSLTNIVMQADTVLKYSFPTLYDEDGDSVSTTMVVLGSASTFMKGGFPNYVLRPRFSNLGEHMISITVTDNNPYPLSGEYKLTVTVTAAPTVDKPTNNQTNTLPNTSNPGGIANPRTNNTSESLKAKIATISNKGLMTIEFNKEMIVPENYTVIDDRVLKLSYKTSDSSTSNFTWKIVSFSSRTIQIQLDFDDPSFISSIVSISYDNILQQKDEIYLQVLMNAFFLEKESEQAIALDYKTEARTIPRQLQDDSNSLPLNLNSLVLNTR